MLDNLLSILKERVDVSERYWEDTYPNDIGISVAQENDNQSWELGFYAGIQFAINELHSEISRQETEKLMTGEK